MRCTIPRLDFAAALSQHRCTGGPEQIRKALPPLVPSIGHAPNPRIRTDLSDLLRNPGIGREELFGFHAAMNVNGLYFDEPFDYHPHVTFAQGLMPETLPAVL